MGDRPVRMQLHRFLGSGSTGDVYGATLDIDGIDIIKTNVALSHVVKLVTKDTSAENVMRISRLQNEFSMYQQIEKARLAGYSVESIPRCYGLYESKYSYVLLLEYAGEPIQDFEQITSSGRYVASSLAQLTRLTEPLGRLCLTRSRFYTLWGYVMETSAHEM